MLVGEESGDIIASGLIKELKKQITGTYNLKFYGVTGHRLKAIGVHSIFDYSEINLLGFSDVFTNYFLKKKLSVAVENIININPDIIISIDAKLFSLSLAKSFKKI